MSNPIIVEITRAGIAESRHTGAYVVIGGEGKLIESAGNIATPIFPRSAIKAFQCLPVIESGAAGRFGFTDEEIALACSSHNGEPEHVRVARSMLAKAGNAEDLYKCGAHWPGETQALHTMIRQGREPGAVHNNCSGKHAGMLALARQLGVDPHDYTAVSHPVQQHIAKTIGELCDIDLSRQPCGIDGCSVPTWAIPLRNLALGFARFASGTGLSYARKAAAQRIIRAARTHPFMVAGTGRFCTRLMTKVPRVFVKTGAEGVFCGCIPHAGIGIALKCDDGASRASQAAMAAVLAGLDVWTDEEKSKLQSFAHTDLTNWRNLRVGELHALM